MRNDELRRKCVTASEMSAIVGLDPYGRTPLTIWLQKMGLVEPQPETTDLRWGRLIESACLQAYAEDTGYLVREHDTMAHSRYAFLAATPDGLVTRPLPRGEVSADRGVEVKTVGFPHAADWGEGVPPYVQVQVAVNMAVFDRQYWDVGRLILATRDWRIETIERDDTLEQMLIDAARTFCEQHMLTKIPPTLDGSREANAYLQQKYPQHTGEMLQADDVPWIMPAIRDYFAHQRAIRTHKQGMEAAAIQIKDAIGHQAGIHGTDFRITWKANKRGWRCFVAKEQGDPDASE